MITETTHYVRYFGGAQAQVTWLVEHAAAGR
jgi:hypothetical protein